MSNGVNNDVIFAKNADFTSINNTGVTESNGLVADGKMWIGSTTVNAGGTHINAGSVTSPLGTLVFGYNSPNITADVMGGGVATQHLTGDNGIVLNPDGAYNFNLLGQDAGSVSVFDTTGSGSTLRFENRAWVTQYVVDASAVVGLRGTFATIQTAITAASSGQTIFIRPGTYTENLTLKAGVNLTAFPCDASLNGTGKVIISGTCTLTTAGTVTISGIQLQTNAAALLAVTGTVASVVNLEDCYLNCTNTTGITYSSSDSSSMINISNSFGDVGTTGISIFTQTSAGRLRIKSCYFTNTGNSTTASTASAGILEMMHTSLQTPITTSGTNTIINMQGCNFSTNVNNATCLTVGGSGTNACVLCNFNSGSASAISVGDNLNLTNSTVNSSNTNAITGAGAINYAGIAYIGSSSLMNTTTKTGKNFHVGGVSWNAGANTITSFTEGTWAPTLALSTPGNSSFTYSAQVGRYWQLGNFVWFEARVILTNYTQGTGSGNVLMANFPFTFANVANQSAAFAVWFQNITFGVAVLWYAGNPVLGSTTCSFAGSRTATTQLSLDAAGLSTTTQIVMSGSFSIA